MLIVSHVSLKQMMSKLLVKTKFDRDGRLLEFTKLRVLKVRSNNG